MHINDCIGKTFNVVITSYYNFSTTYPSDWCRMVHCHHHLLCTRWLHSNRSRCRMQIHRKALKVEIVEHCIIRPRKLPMYYYIKSQDLYLFNSTLTGLVSSFLYAVIQQHLGVNSWVQSVEHSDTKFVMLESMTT